MNGVYRIDNRIHFVKSSLQLQSIYCQWDVRSVTQRSFPTSRKKESRMVSIDQEIGKKNKVLLKKRFPSVAKKLESTLDDDSCRAAVVRVEDGVMIARGLQNRRDFLYDRAALDHLLIKIESTKTPEPYDTVILLGMGLGEAALKIIRKFRKKPRLMIIEPYAALFKQAVENTDITALLRYDHLSLYLGVDARARPIVKAHENRIPIGRTIVFIHPYNPDAIDERFEELQSGLFHHVKAAMDQWHTTKRLGKRMLSNTIANLPSVFYGTPMRTLRNRFKNIPAICIAAGPSLTVVLPRLKRVENALLIACDSSVNALLKAGIMPHFVATADIYAKNIAKLKPHRDRLRDTVLVFGVESNPDNVRTYLGERRVAIAAYSQLILNRFNRSLNLQCEFPKMTSVTHLAFHFAAAIGANPIILAGVDQAHVDGLSHYAGAVSRHIAPKEKLVEVEGVRGSKVYAPPELATDRIVLEEKLASHSGRVISTGLSGAFIDGVEIKSIEEVVETELTEEVDLSSTMDSIFRRTTKDDASFRFDLIDLINQFNQFLVNCRQQNEEVMNVIATGKKANDPSGFEKEYHNTIENFEELQDRFKEPVAILNGIVFAERQAIRQKQLVDAANPSRSATERKMNALEAVSLWLQAYIENIDEVIHLLKPVEANTREEIDLRQKCDSVHGQYEHHLERARLFRQQGELWRAVKEFKLCIKTDSRKPIAYEELTQIYMEMELWNSALGVVSAASNEIKDAGVFDSIELDIDKTIDSIWKQIEQKWKDGKQAEARKLLNNYLFLNPKDPKALDLEQSMLRLDMENSRHWNKNGKKQSAEKRIEERIRSAAIHLQNLKMEKSIGILEGIIEDFPKSSKRVREQIGDIRKMNKDYTSAIWNYSEALKFAPDNQALLSKLHQVKSYF